MKIIASILAVYFGLLMMQPFIRVEDGIVVKPAKACSGSICHKMMNHQKGTRPCSNTAGCNTDLCNPFVPCSISLIFRTAQLNFSKPVLDLLTNEKPAINENITSAYLPDCWRPPQLS